MIGKNPQRLNYYDAQAMIKPYVPDPKDRQKLLFDNMGFTEIIDVPYETIIANLIAEPPNFLPLTTINKIVNMIRKLASENATVDVDTVAKVEKPANDGVTSGTRDRMGESLSFKEFIKEGSVPISVGKTYKIYVYSAAKNQKVEQDAEIVGYEKKPGGAKPMVTYKSNGKTSTVSSDKFKSMVKG